MNCKSCNIAETRGDDSTTLNDFGLCRVCQKARDVPMPWKRGKGKAVEYGCYFPYTDLNVNEMGGRGTGKPVNVEWLA